MLALRDRRLFDLGNRAARLEEMEGAIVNYFRSRKEDNKRAARRVVMVPRRGPQPVRRHRRRRPRPVLPGVLPILPAPMVTRLNSGFY